MIPQRSKAPEETGVVVGAGSGGGLGGRRLVGRLTLEVVIVGMLVVVVMVVLRREEARVLVRHLKAGQGPIRTCWGLQHAGSSRRCSCTRRRRQATLDVLV